MTKISSLTIRKLKNGQLEKIIPEFYELKNVIESNEWHHNDSVFNHTINVIANLEKLFRKYPSFNKYLNQKIGDYSRKELLFLSALLHDIGKKETIVKRHGITSCPKHEIKGAVNAKKILKRLGLPADDVNFVAKIVRNHLLIYNMFRIDYKSRARQKIKYRSILIELSLLSMADMFGTQLKAKNPDEFKKMAHFYKSVLESSIER